MWSDMGESPSEEERSPSEYEVDEIRENLLKCINGIKATGSFATGGVIDITPIPGICVDGEPVTVPLSKEAARNLASRSDKAPFGENGGTVAGETVRKTPEISAKRISFRNPAWQNFVNDLVKRVSHELGVPPEYYVRAELYKNLLYEPGAMFKAHKDTEKVPGMFGTLVICLPSEHTGGTVCLRHGGNSLELSTAESSAFESFYLAWYADVTHEVKSIQTGYRWVLTYNLINDFRGTLLSAGVLNSQIELLVNTLSSWQNLQSAPDFLVYRFHHQYAPRDLRLSGLKGNDYQHARYLADSCARHGKFYLFLAHLEMRESWPYGESLIGEDQPTREWYLYHIHNLEGFELSPTETKIEEESILEPISYHERDPDSCGGGEYLGDEMADLERISLNSVALIIPENSLHVPLVGTMRYFEKMEDIMNCLRTGISNGTDTSLQKILVRLCRIILDGGFAAEEENDMYLGCVAVTAAFLGDRSLFQEAQKETCAAWHGDSWYSLGGLIDLQVPSVDEDDIIAALLKYRRFRGAYRGLDRFYAGFRSKHAGQDQAKAESWKQWYNDRLVELLGHYTHGMGQSEADIIMGIASHNTFQSTPEQREKVDEALANFVDRFKEEEEFVNTLTFELLLELSRADDARLIFLRRLFSIILEVAISTFNLEPRFLYYSTRRGDEYCCSIAKLVREFYNRALEHSEDTASRLLRELSKQAPKIKAGIAQISLLPLMEELLPVVNTDSPEAQNYFQSLTKAYIIGNTAEPPKPANWARPAEVHTCEYGCNKCSMLTPFLRNPEAKEITITLSIEDEDHLKQNFSFLTIRRINPKSRRVHFTKTLEGWRELRRDWKLEVEKAKRNLRDLLKDDLKRALGDQYDALTAPDPAWANRGADEQGGVDRAPDGAGSPTRTKRSQGEDLDDAGRETAPKRTLRQRGN